MDIVENFVCSQNIAESIHNIDYVNPKVDLDYITLKYFRRFQAQTNVYKSSKEVYLLPICYHRDSLLKSINSYKVVIVEGGTGTGKSTRVPFYILDNFVTEQKQCANIYVTQPRRIAAKNIAKRVCFEQEWELGSIVGYHIGLDRVTGPDTMLTFCTSGVLLQKLITEGNLNAYSHIIIDEAHERDAETDLLLMIIKTFMLRDKSNFRLIIMSATIDMESLVDYLSYRPTYGHSSTIIPIVNRITPPIQAVNTFKIDIIYIEEIFQFFNITDKQNFDFDEPELNFKLLRLAVKLVTEFIPTRAESMKHRSILIFLPGLSDIEHMQRLLEIASASLDVIPLHSCLSSIDQAKVFREPEPGITKVILSTNIAESSITVKDIAYIIDFCLSKVLIKDQYTNFPCLKLIWESKDQATQRAGRTGRCCPGTVIRMIPRKLYDSFQKFATPEIQMAPLESSVLKVKKLEMGDCKSLLSLVRDPPNETDIRDAILELKQIGALACTYRNEVRLDDGDLTELGRIISVLPIDVRLSKFIVFGYVFDVLEECITIAACMSTNRNVIRHIFGQELETYTRKLNWAAGSNSDLIVSLKIFNEYSAQVARGKSKDLLRIWCDQVQVDEGKLHETLSLVNEIKFRLQEYNMSLFDAENRMKDTTYEELMIKIAISAAFYPNYFLNVKFDDYNISRELLNQDPNSTIIMSNFPQNQAPLYFAQISAQIERVVDDYNFQYFADGTRALIKFHSGEKLDATRSENCKKAIGVSGIVEATGNGVCKQIYIILKYNQHQQFEIRPYHPDAALVRLKQLKKQRDETIIGNGIMPPATILLVKGRPVDNSHLLHNILREDPRRDFIELQVDEDLDENDMNELSRIEEEEEIRGNDLDDENRPSVYSELFESQSRRIRTESPIQLIFEGILHRSKAYQIVVDKSSVNSVILDSGYESNRSCLLIAGNVKKAQKSVQQLVLQQTTLMPCIRGLPSLLALLFASSYQYKSNLNVNCLAGACFGLGWDASGKSLCKDYEVDMAFDVLIDDKDVESINRCRSILSNIIKMINSNNPGKPLLDKQIEMREMILSLLRRRRFPIAPVEMHLLDSNSNLDVVGNKIFNPIIVTNDTVDIVNHIDNENSKENINIKTTPLTTYKSDEYFSIIHNNLKELNEIYEGTARVAACGIRCFLCNNGFGKIMFTQREVYLHLDSLLHAKRLELLKSNKFGNESFDSATIEPCQRQQQVLSSWFSEGRQSC